MSDQEYGMGLGEDMGFDLPSTAVQVPGAPFDNPLDEPQDDDFWGNAFDEEVIDAALKSDLPPEGWYTGPLPNQVERQNRFEPRPELSVSGRLMHVSGASAMVFLNLCPKKYYKQDGRVGFDYLKYKEAIEAYIADNGSKPTNAEDFKSYLANTNLAVRLVPQINGKGMKAMEVRSVKSAIEKGYITEETVQVIDDIPF